MSAIRDYTPNQAAYVYARWEAINRARKQWSNPIYWNLWKRWRIEENPDWFDPWYEYETRGINNGPSTGDGDPAYEMTQNLYYCYCYLKWKGFNNYSIIGMMTSAIQESSITGGVWEGNLQNNEGYASKHPYESLKRKGPLQDDYQGFDSTYDGMPNPDALGRMYTWFYGGSYPLYSNGSAVEWDAEFLDNRNPRYLWKRHLTGWNAVKRYPLALAQYQIVGYPDPLTLPVGSTVLVDPPYYRVNESANNTTALQLNTNSPGYTGNGTGYGFCQWTPWTKLPRTCKAGYLSYGLQEFNEANKHWQMNGTLQLMVWELERYINRVDPDGDLNSGEYLGQWINSRVASASIDGAYFIWPYQSNNLDNPQLWHFYGRSCSFDEYASGAYLEHTEELIEALEDYPNMTDEDKDWCRRQMALAIYRSAFLQATYKDFDFQSKSYYIKDCISYWDANPLTGNQYGWSVYDIPRPRDLPYCELDAFHLNPNYIPFFRRKKHNVRTILL